MIGEKDNSTVNRQSSLAAGSVHIDEGNAQKKESKRRKYQLLSILLICVIVLFTGFFVFKQLDNQRSDRMESTGWKESTGLQTAHTWSQWMNKLPASVDESKYIIEEQTLYRSRKKETTSSTTTDTMDGWELYDTIAGNGGFGPWSDWSSNTAAASDDREVETQTIYFYRDKETTTHSSSFLQGWELSDVTYSWGKYGNWSNWTTTPLSSSDSRKVETKTQYMYRDLEYIQVQDPDLVDSYTAAGWVETKHQTDYWPWSDWTTTPMEGSWDVEVEIYREYQYTEYYLAHYCTGNVPGAQYCTFHSSNSANQTFNDNCVYHELGWYDSLSSFSEGNGGYIGSTCSNSCWTWYILGENDVYTTYYRSRRIVHTYTLEKYSSWSDWSDYAYSSTSDREVKTRTLYRCKDREQIPTYQFWRWGEWIEYGSQEIAASNNRQVDSVTYYRYRDRTWETLYCFLRWGEWSDYSKKPISATDAIQVESITQYRFKEKD